MSAYYNEIDPFAAAWLRELIKAGHIAPGDVDERSIADVKPVELLGYTQCHFFAGIGVWSHALRCAGWPDDRPVWTGSCPCQPFSAAGKGEGTSDARHLWPEWFRLVRECRPVVVFGEQVGAAIRHGWLDLVSADLEGLGYAVGAAVVGAHSVGAPHIRQRLFFVADAASERRVGIDALLRPEADRRLGEETLLETAGRSEPGKLADAEQRGRQSGAERPVAPEAAESAKDNRASGVALGDTNDAGPQGRRVQPGERAGERAVGAAGSADGVGDSTGVGRESRARDGSLRAPNDGAGAAAEQQRSEGASGFWSACDWLPCIDGKARPVEPGTFPLAHGATQRVGRLRAYGNAIVAPQAEEFIRAYMSACP